MYWRLALATILILLAGCSPDYDGAEVLSATEVDFWAADSARCGDLEINMDGAELVVDGARIRVPRSESTIRRIGFSPNCAIAFVESYADPDRRAIDAVNVSTNAIEASVVEDGSVAWSLEGSKFLGVFVSRQGGAWASVWQDPETLQWTVSAVALEWKHDRTRRSGSTDPLDAAPTDAQLHIEEITGRAQFFTVTLGAAGTTDISLNETS